MTLLATIIILLVLPLSAQSQATDYLPDFEGATWQYDISFEGDQVLKESVQRTDTLGEIRQAEEGQRYTILSRPAGNYQWVVQDQTIYAPFHVMVIPDELENLIPKDIIEDRLLPLFRFDASTDIVSEILSVSEKTEFPNFINELIDFPVDIDSVEIALELTGQRIGTEEIEIADESYSSQVFENTLSLSLELDAGLIDLTIPVLDDYTVISYWTKKTGLMLQEADEFDLTSNIPSDFIPSGASASIPAFRTEMTHFESEEYATFSEPEQAPREIPSGITVHQNYPNPFNPITTISFQLDQPGTVTISVYDIQGRQMKEIARNEQLSAGTHYFDVDGSDWPSGNYMYRVQYRPDTGSSGTITRTRVMSLIK